MHVDAVTTSTERSRNSFHTSELLSQYIIIELAQLNCTWTEVLQIM